MQTQDSQLRKIQEENEEARRKLQGFRSGLQKMMRKKSQKKSQRHQPPSHDIKKSYTNQQSQLQYKSNNPINQSPLQLNNKLQQSQFGFNSTLFRQLNDQTVLSNNSSGVNQFYKHQNNINQYDNNNYGSVGSLNSQKTGEYYSTSTKKSQQLYNYQSFTPSGININNNNGKSSYETKQPQTFKKSSLLFSEIDQLMNKVNKSSKFPVKPIQKYINQQQSKLMSESKQIDLTLSNSSLILSSDQNKKKTYSQLQLRKKEKLIQNDDGKRNFKKEQNKVNKVTAKQSLKQTGSFLKNMKQRSSSIQGMKQPPLPPNQLPAKPQNNKINQITTNRDKGEDFLQWGRKISQNKVQSKGQQLSKQEQVQQIKGQQRIVNKIKKQQTIANKIKSTINERKKLIKQEGLMDDSIELQLSSQQQQQDNKDISNTTNERQNKNKTLLVEIQRLQQQKQLLLSQLKHIQAQLQQLQSQM